MHDFDDEDDDDDGGDDDDDDGGDDDADDDGKLNVQHCRKEKQNGTMKTEKRQKRKYVFLFPAPSEFRIPNKHRHFSNSVKKEQTKRNPVF